MRRHALLAVLLALVLTGCDAKVTTDIRVTSPTVALAHVSVELRDQGAAAVVSNPKLVGELQDLFRKWAGTTPTMHLTQSDVKVEADIDYTHLVAASLLTGVGAATLGPPASGTGRALTVQLVVPTGLSKAIDSAVAGQPDAAGLSAAYKGSLSVSVVVHFAGGVTDVRFVDTNGAPTKGGGTIVRHKTSVEVSQPLSRFVAGTLVVVGSPALSGWEKLIHNGWWLAGLIVVLAAILTWRRSRQVRPGHPRRGRR